MTKNKNTQPRPRTELADQIQWWDSFNMVLYLQICEIKARTR